MTASTVGARTLRAANDNLPPVVLQPPGLAPVTIAELELLETYLGDLIADIIEGDAANDNVERHKE
ncbi:MAG: hypothetical protein ACE5FO_05695 [Parvularculaceae bacterium]